MAQQIDITPASNPWLGTPEVASAGGLLSAFGRLEICCWAAT